MEYANCDTAVGDKNNNPISNRKVASSSLPLNNNIEDANSESDSDDIADINVTQSVSNYKPNYLQYVTFSVNMYNNGPNTAHNITTSYLLNNHYLKWISDDGQGSYNYKTGIWSVQTLENGTNITLHVVAQIIASNITITNRAIYTSGSTIDPNNLNDLALISLNVPPSADISITNKASIYNPKYLSHIYLTIIVKNNGPNNVQNLTINTGLNPTLLKFLSRYGNGYFNYKTGIWTISSLRSGCTNILHIKLKVMAFNINIKNIVSYQPNIYDSNQKNNKAGISLTVPKLTISSLAYSLAIDTTTRYARALNIFNWVRDYVDYSFYYGTRYGASGTLNLLKGNCVDLSRLIVALSRAIGIPVRYRYGTCYFYKSHHWISHVWTNIYVNHKWYSADASNNINQFGVIKSWNTSNYISNGIYKTLPF